MTHNTSLTRIKHIRRSVFIPAETEETQNTKVIGDFPTFPKKGIAPDFDISRRNSKPWKLGRENG
jgi:hypothetical protein